MAGVAVTGFLFSSSSASQPEQLMETQPVVSRIAFGSCANQDAPQVFVLLACLFVISSSMNVRKQTLPISCNQT